MALPLLLLLPLLSPAGPGPDARRDEVELARLLKQVQRRGDEVDLEVFGRIAAFKTPESLETLQRALESLEAPGVLFRAYLAFSTYRGVPELEQRAIDFLHRTAREHDQADHQRLATQGLTYFHAAAHPALERLVREHPSDVVRGVALQPVVRLLGQRGTPEDARLILEFAQIRGGRSGQDVAEALAGCRGPEVDRLLAARLGEEGLTLAWTEMLIGALAARSGPGVEAALLAMLEHESTLIRVRALEVLGRRGDPRLYKPLRRSLRAEDGLERRQAIVAVTGVASQERSWPRTLQKYARSRHVAERMGAAGGLALLGTEEALETLHGLLEDEDWRVRLEVVERLTELRRADSVPALIERMGAEDGRQRGSFARALRRLTAQDHGLNPARWAEWWAAEGEVFVLPSAEAAAAAEAERREHHTRNDTVASFYGLPLVSDHVTFVLDVSGSMLSPAGTWARAADGEDRAPKRTRLDVAQTELAGALERLSRNVRFNVIFFHTAVVPWREELTRRSDKEAEDAVRFARRQTASGSTNIYGGLMKAFEDPTVDAIYLLSDGSPSAGELINPDQLREHVRRINGLRKVQINCIAIGQPSPFLRQLAQENDGAYTEAL